MAVTTDPFVAADQVAVTSETWTDIVNEKTFNDTVLANFITDLSPFAQSGSDIFHVPDIYTNALTVSTQSTQGAEINTAGPAQVDTTLTVSTHKYVAFIMGDLTFMQVATKYNIMEIYARQAKSLLTEALEADIAALWSSITTNVIGDTATVLSDAEIRQGLYLLENLKYSLNECAFFFHPYVYWNQLHAVTKYYQQYSVGPSSVAGPVRTGNFGVAGYEKNFKGYLYGLPVYTTTNIVSALLTYRNLLLHPRCLGFAIQSYRKEPISSPIAVSVTYEPRNLGTLGLFSIIYGVGALRQEAGVVLNASNTFIGS